jgi:hypothetical protein
MTHPKVPHPSLRRGRALLTREHVWFVRVNDRLLDWMTDRFLGSVLMFDVALIAPFIVLPMSDSAKLFLAVISSTWIQWWGLHSVTRNAKMKADADHQAFTHMATVVDETRAIMDEVRAKVILAELRADITAQQASRPRETKEPTP